MRLLRKKRSRETEFEAPIRPETAFYAMGDIHGCAALFERLIARLEEIAHPTARLVLVGDYVDRGDQSAEVLKRLFTLQNAVGDDVMVCLRGNHDQMLLDFLDSPSRAGPRWLRHGGLQTLASYGIGGVLRAPTAQQWDDIRNRLRDAIGGEIEDWLRRLPMAWQTGNVLVSHAGADPSAPCDEQTEKSLLWGHPDFGKIHRKDGMWVVHGHTITEHPPKAVFGRIPVDTGAYATGRLTAALIEPESIQFIST